MFPVRVSVPAGCENASPGNLYAAVDLKKEGVDSEEWIRKSGLSKDV